MQPKYKCLFIPVKRIDYTIKYIYPSATTTINIQAAIAQTRLQSLPRSSSMTFFSNFRSITGEHVPIPCLGDDSVSVSRSVSGVGVPSPARRYESHATAGATNWYAADRAIIAQIAREEKRRASASCSLLSEIHEDERKGDPKCFTNTVKTLSARTMKW